MQRRSLSAPRSSGQFRAPPRLQSRGHPAYRRAGEAGAALGRGKMIADDFLHSRHAVAECREVALSRAGKDLHQRPAADLARRLGREMGQSGERTPFRFAVRAFNPRVQYEKNAPISREADAGHDRRDVRARPPAGVHGEAAELEQRCADTRAHAAIEQARVGANIDRQPGEFDATRPQSPARAEFRSRSPHARVLPSRPRPLASCRRQGLQQFGALDVRPARGPPPQFQSVALHEPRHGSRTHRWRDRSIRIDGQGPR